MLARSQIIWIGCGLLLAVALLWLKGCGYGELSESGYQHAQALYAICNRRDEQALSEFASRVTRMHNDKVLHDQEADWLQAIIEQARGGDWAAAQLETRALMESQLVE